MTSNMADAPYQPSAMGVGRKTGQSVPAHTSHPSFDHTPRSFDQMREALKAGILFTTICLFWTVTTLIVTAVYLNIVHLA